MCWTSTKSRCAPAITGTVLRTTVCTDAMHAPPACYSFT